jgi:hypothetical protein
MASAESASAGFVVGMVAGFEPGAMRDYKRKRQPKLPLPLKAPDSAPPRLLYRAGYADVGFVGAAAGAAAADFEP